MKITEQQLRQIIREELVNEGIFDDISDKFSGAMGSVRSFFGGSEGGSPSAAARPINLASLIPTTGGKGFFSRVGFTPDDVIRILDGRSMETKTDPARVRIYVLGDTGTMVEHPTAPRGMAGMLGQNSSGEIEIPQGTPSHFIDREFGTGSLTFVHKFPDTDKPEKIFDERDLKRAGVNMDMWAQFTASMSPPQKRGAVKKLLRAISVAEAIERAFNRFNEVYGQKAVQGGFFTGTGSIHSTGQIPKGFR